MNPLGSTDNSPPVSDPVRVASGKLIFRQPSDLVICMIGGVAWECDTQTGEFWPVVSDTEMSEAEVESEVRGAGSDLSAARELIRADVR
jgi:hypothetical protein